HTPLTAAPGHWRRGALPHSGPRIVRNTSRQTPVQDPMTLEFALNNAAVASANVDCVVVGAYADKTFTPAARAIDEASGGRLTALAERGDVSGATGRSAMLHDLAGVTAPRVLVIGLGEPGKFAVPQYLKAVADAVRALKTGPVRSALLTLSELEVPGRDAAWSIRQAAIAAGHAAYRYTATLGEKNKKRDEKGLERLEIAGSDAAALAQGQAIAAGVAFTRELGHLPPNICNPAYLADQAQEFAAKFDKASCEVLERDEMEKLGMGSLLAVARGSANAPKLIVLKWNNGGDATPYVLVGTGSPFDPRGVNLTSPG